MINSFGGNKIEQVSGNTLRNVVLRKIRLKTSKITTFDLTVQKLVITSHWPKQQKEKKIVFSSSYNFNLNPLRPAIHCQWEFSLVVQVRRFLNTFKSASFKYFPNLHSLKLPPPNVSSIMFTNEITNSRRKPGFLFRIKSFGPQRRIWPNQIRSRSYAEEKTTVH